ncbi:MAG: bifunctional adenosylcobinamide kinase/adenosylcobinamide-phosphate guanylyltransferase, partial [Dehalococcoidales bacterium]|nr:bifunctional adenosylcobinamide kinase/adenosylcobinamide-phosphate guanylyltransferase [Dehalococcoidales bacterium]
RIEAHQQSRPAGWTTLETTTGLGPQITKHIGGIKTVIVDCITLLVSNIFQENEWREEPELLDKAVREEINGLIASMEASGAHFIIVSNEVGLGIVPADRISRIYRDVLGRANQMLAARCDEVYLLVSGIPMTLKKSGS